MKKLMIFVMVGVLILLSVSVVIAHPIKDNTDKKCYFKDGNLKPNAPSYCTIEDPIDKPPIAQPFV